MTDAIDTTPSTTSGSRWGRATVGPYTLLITPEAVAVSVPRVVGNELRSKLYRATLADLEHGFPGSGVLDRFLTASSRCCISTVHSDEEGQRWINVYLHVADLDRPSIAINGEAHHECLTINVMNPAGCALDVAPTAELEGGVPLAILAIA